MKMKVVIETTLTKRTYAEIQDICKDYPGWKIVGIPDDNNNMSVRISTDKMDLNLQSILSSNRWRRKPE